jgi:hypothetical protein
MPKPLQVIEVTTAQIASMPWQGHGVLLQATDDANGALYSWSTVVQQYVPVGGVNPQLAQPGFVLGVYSWYARPNPYQNKGKFILMDGIPANDVSLWRSNGKAWTPVGGKVLVGHLGPSESLLNTADSIIDKLQLPGDLLYGWGKLLIEAQVVASNNANAKTLKFTIADPNLGTEHWAFSSGSLASTPGGQINTHTHPLGRHGRLRSGGVGNTGVGFGSSVYADSIDTSYDFEVRIRVQKATATDIVQVTHADVYAVYGSK